MGLYKMINGLPFRMKNVKEGVDVRVIASSPKGDLWGWEGSWWNISYRELSRSPVKYNGSEPCVHVSGDKITFEGQTYYSYSVTQNEWIQYDSWISMSSHEICWKNKYYSTTTQPYTISTPEGKTLTLRPHEFFGEPTFDAQGNIYIQSYGEGYESQIWTDHNCEWESIVSYDETFICIAVSDNAEHTIWGADGGSYLVFLHDGKWMEVVLLPSGTKGYM